MQHVVQCLRCQARIMCVAGTCRTAVTVSTPTGRNAGGGGGGGEEDQVWRFAPGSRTIHVFYDSLVCTYIRSARVFCQNTLAGPRLGCRRPVYAASEAVFPDVKIVAAA